MNMLHFSLLMLKRRFWKNIAVFFIFTFLIFLLSSILLISSSIKKELFVTLDNLPDIFVQRVVAGRLTPMSRKRVEKIEAIEGVEAAYPRVWGYYYFKAAGVNFSVIGVDFDDVSYKKSLNSLIASNEKEGDFMYIGEGVKRVLNEHAYKKFFNFITPKGEFVKVNVAGLFPSSSALESSDTIVVPIALARKIFDLEEDKIIDMVLSVPNPKEIATIAQKIRFLYPDTRVLTKEDLKASYQNIFDYKVGLFLALFVAAFFAFFILVFEKASSISKSEVKEIGILKALGWQIEDILKLKFLESALVIFFALALGVVASYYFVYILQAPLLRDIFSGYSVLKPTFQLLPVWDSSLFVTLFLITVPLYLAATIIPSWRASVIDPEEALR